MKFQRRKVASALAYALGVGGAALVVGVPAQAADIKVEVTGSNIKRIEGEGALPVQTISREDITKSGAQDAMELMNLISANNSAGNVSVGNVIGATTFSNQTASLRGLGGTNTLVLINGKRLGTFAGGISGAEGVNLSAIPLAAIERVEILKDGASAIYGSDAIAGVINFIMRQDFTGYEATAYGAWPTRTGGGDAYKVSGTAGWGDLTKDKWNAFISASYQEQKPLNQADRNFSKTNYIPSEGVNTTSGQTFPGFVYNPATGASLGNPGFPNCDPSIVVGTRCRFDPARYQGVEGIPDTKQLNLFGTARFQINADWQAYLTGMYAQQETRFIIQPTPLSDQIFTTATADGASTITVQPTSPFYPHAFAIAHGVDGQPLGVRYRCVICGLRDNTDTNDAWQIVAGVKGTQWNWDWDFSFNGSENTTKEKPNGGFFQYTKILPFLNSGVVNFFGPNSDAVQQQAKALDFTDTAFDAKNKGYGFDLKGSSDIYKLPAGPMSLALGIQEGYTSFSQTPNAVLFTGDLTGYGGNLVQIDHSRTQWAVYGELNIPIIKTLEADLAVRYDHYSDFGSTTNPKISLRWQPIQQLLVRGSWGTGFLAPTLYQLYNPQVPGLSSAGVSDPLRCPNPDDAANPDCNTQFTATFGGNPSLQPEKANQTSVGVVWEPMTGVSIGVDGFYMDVKDQVSNGVPISTILDPALYSLYSGLVTRAATCAPSAFVPGAPCPITAIDQRFVNLGEAKIAGIDIDAKFTSQMTTLGRWSLAFSGTYYTKYDVLQADGSFAGFISNAYQAPATGITPRFKSYTALNWNYGPWAATLANSYQSSYIDVNTDNNDNQRRVGSLSLWDLQANYTGFKNWTLTVGAKNLFDTNPPFTNTNLTFQSGYDPSYYNALARVVYGSVTFAFK